MEQEGEARETKQILTYKRGSLFLELHKNCMGCIYCIITIFYARWKKKPRNHVTMTATTS